jgi:UDP-N-acetylmuramoyl-tripeptide--D-alanyl-D-alanine ligase
MLELGKDSRYWHEQLGKWVAQAHIDRLIVTGEMAKVVAEAAMCDGMKAGAIAIVDTMEHIVSSLSDSISRETIVLVKASRGLKLDRVVTYLKAVA